MSAISGIRRQAKELVDGTIRLTVDFEPSQRKLFWELLPEIDMPVGIAPLKPDYQRETTSNTVVKQSSTTSDYVADVNNKVNKKPYGDLAKTLYLSYFGALSFLRTPKVLE